MTNGTKYLLQKFGVSQTKIVNATANFIFLKPLAKLAMIVTTYILTTATRDLLQKFQVNSTKIVSTVANFLFFRGG